MEETRQHGPRGDECHADDAYACTPGVYITYIIYIGAPLLNEVGGDTGHLHTQKVLDLRSENGDGDTRGEAYDDGVGNVLDNGTQTQHP